MDGFQLKTVLQAERDLIRSTLEFHNGNRTRSARTLGITSNTLRNKMVQFGFSDDFRSLGGRPKNSVIEPAFSFEPALNSALGGPASDLAAVSLEGAQSGRVPTESLSFQKPSRLDFSTGFTDSVAFRETVEKRIRMCREAGLGFGVALLAVDFNRQDAMDSDLGIDIAEETHLINAMLLAEAVGSVDVVVRTAASKFKVLLDFVGGEEEARARVEAIWDKIQYPMGLDAKPMADQLAMGFSVYPSDGQKAGDLINAAQVALRESSTFNERPIVRFETRMRDRAKIKVAIRSGLRQTLAMGKIVPFYQPKIDLRHGQVIGFEALLRQIDPINGIKMPAQFEKAFEDRFMSKQLSDRILDGVTTDVSDWISHDVRFGYVSLNASVAEFSHVRYGDMLIEALDTRHLDPRNIKIEIPERALADTGSGRAFDTIRSLRTKGFEIALDDFGIGFATLPHLKELAISEIKLDRSLVAKLETDSAARRIIASTIEMATELDIAVVAKGVETLGQAVLLKGMGCVVAQGHIFGKPMRARNIPSFIEAFPRKIRQVLDFNDISSLEGFVR